MCKANGYNFYEFNITVSDGLCRSVCQQQTETFQAEWDTKKARYILLPHILQQHLL
jgi:hypothetical protein